MLWTIVVLLLILWLLGFTLHVAGGLIHILLVIALVVIVLQLLTGRRVEPISPVANERWSRAIRGAMPLGHSRSEGHRPSDTIAR